jgi:5-methylcytosine-specific restriction enzyme A
MQRLWISDLDSSAVAMGNCFMPRALPEWFGTTPDTPPPPRVRLRVFERFAGRCQCGCRRKIAAGEVWHCDHIVALINGGLNCESNLQPLLLAHHLDKTIVEVAEKAKIAAQRLKHLGLHRPSQPLPFGRNSVYKKTMRGAVVERVSQSEAHRALMRKRDLCGND